jgi:hypothetical protein
MLSIKAAIVATLISTSTLSAFAQGQGHVQYEYAVVVYVIGEKFVRISVAGKQHETVPIDKDYKPTKFDLTPALTQIGAMSEEGWESFNHSSHSYGANDIDVYSFYLRRPKQQ